MKEQTLDNAKYNKKWKSSGHDGVPYHHECIARAVQAQGKIFASAFIFWLQLVLMDNNVGASKHQNSGCHKNTLF
jgi:hypothetical protein